MRNPDPQDVRRHIKTHSVSAHQDLTAVSLLDNLLLSTNRIVPHFTANDKGPNHDGTFEYIQNPEDSLQPKHTFYAQIKGTGQEVENRWPVKYRLQDLAFPAFIKCRVTHDPGILFVVLRPDSQRHGRVFWKHMSDEYLDTIDFSKNSVTVSFLPEDEICDTDESKDAFCQRLSEIIAALPGQPLTCAEVPDTPSAADTDDAELPESPYVYRRRLSAMAGRDEEMARLRDFVTGGRADFRWWAITGDGGSGKSRLALELAEWVRRQRGWTCHNIRTVDPNEYADLPGLFDDCDGPTLLIADYVQAHARALGRQIEAERARDLRPGPGRRHPLRLLLVERTGRTVRDREMGLDWVTQLFEDVQHRDWVIGSCHDGGQFLALRPMGDDALREIMRSFAASYRAKGLSDHPLPGEADCDELLRRLKAIDPELRRPLYALFLTGTWMDGDEPERWSPEEVLGFILRREEALLDGRIREVTHSDTQNSRILKAAQYLTRLATARLGLPLAQAARLEKQWGNLEKAAEKADLEDAEDLLRRLGLVRGERLRAMEPDIMGEFFVYDWLVAVSERERLAFLRLVWEDSDAAFTFFDRLFRDYAHLINESPEQWGLLLPPLEELRAGVSEADAVNYAKLTVNVTARCSHVEQFKAFVARLEDLYRNHPDNKEIAVQLAKGLFNLTVVQDAAGLAATVDRLEGLYRDHPDSGEIAEPFAKGLFNLACKQDEAGRADAVDRLEGLYRDHPDSGEIAVLFAKGLVNLTAVQDAAGRAAAVDRLEGLYRDHPDSGEIAVQLAMGLFNLACEQDDSAALATLDRILPLAERFPDAPRMQEILFLRQDLRNIILSRK